MLFLARRAVEEYDRCIAWVVLDTFARRKTRLASRGRAYALMTLLSFRIRGLGDEEVLSFISMRYLLVLPR